MVTDKIPMTERGYKRLQDELKFLKNKERQKVIQAIEEALKHGDLSENAEYKTAKERQSFIEGRISELESKLARANVIDIYTLSGTKVKFGATVELYDEDVSKEITYQIVGTDEADIEQGLLSCSAPLARAMIGKEEGETIEVQTPAGTRLYEILKVRYENVLR